MFLKWNPSEFVICDGMDAGHKNYKMSLAAGQRGQHVA